MISFPPRAKILIADDDPIASQVLRLALQRLGHQVVVARDGAEAWSYFDEDPVRVIISDWMMPGLDGLQLCEKVRNRTNTPYTYFILLTGAHTSADDYSMAMDSGVDDFLLKPFDPAMVRARIRVAERIITFATQVKQLKDLIPMCSYCRKIRDDQDYWQQVESYINEQTGSRFSHGICPDCFTQVISEIEAGKHDLAAI
jgi:DNA-binding response OmpR family regulator